MANTYYATIHAKFYNEKLRDDWLMEHGVNQSIPKGGPVTSYSQDYEGDYRDKLNNLRDALQRSSQSLYTAKVMIEGLGQHQNEAGYKTDAFIWLERGILELDKAIKDA